MSTRTTTTRSANEGAEWTLEKPLPRYLFALAMAIVATFVRMLVAPLTGTGVPFVLFFGATLVTCLVAGTGPGLALLAVSLPFSAYMFVVRAGHPVAQATFQSLLYAVDGLLIVLLTARVTNAGRMIRRINRDLRRANERIADAASRAREIIELAPDAFFLADLDGRLVDVNGSACRLLGYERDELIGKTILDIIPAEDAQRLERVKAELMAPGTVERGEWVHIRKDGTRVPLELSANILPGGRWQAFARDISERRRMEDERQVLVSLLDNSSDFIGTADPSGKPTYLNPAGRRMVGLSPDFPIEKTKIEDYYPPSERAFANGVILKSMLERGRWSGETRFRNFRTEEVIPVSDEHFLVRDASSKRVLGMATITRDITEQQRRELEIQRAVHARDQVLSIVAHDLRNPLNTIVMQVLALRRSGLEPERRDQKPVERISRAAARMARLIQDLLDVALLEAGSLKVMRACSPVADLVHEAVEMQRDLATSASVDVSVDIEGEVPELWVDRHRLLQVFENLIGNAIKFTSAGGRIEVRVSPREWDVLFCVSDTGCGIAAEHLPRVFDPFWQATASARRLGAGLGLPITKGIVEAHGGRIWAESVPGHGTAFLFSIPKGRPQEEQPSYSVH